MLTARQNFAFRSGLSCISPSKSQVFILEKREKRSYRKLGSKGCNDTSSVTQTFGNIQRSRDELVAGYDVQRQHQISCPLSLPSMQQILFQSSDSLKPRIRKIGTLVAIASAQQ
ncbi:hypothetical protein AcV5_008109 [Taiwanofungus camphoratus]|nr:hypothetical protein AcV5_008109 [Antrodia cinnamomea]KAI0930921.1 hypothetical protein AcV7_004969 [Antrodia cinnamomea]